MKFGNEKFQFDERKEILDGAARKARNVTEHYEIRSHTFADLYSQDVVDADREEVERLERIFHEEATPEDKERKEIADILEALILEQGEMSEWFGPQACTIKTSRYDDVKNGVDSVVEFSEEGKRVSHAALAIDATYSKDFDKKFKRIKRRIKEGDLTRIKYFTSEYSPFRGELSQVPMTVVGADVETIEELSHLWLENKKKELGTHWIQFQVLEELVGQCTLFAEYARSVGKDNIAASYEHIQHIAEEVYHTKQEEIQDPEIRDSNLKEGLRALERVLFH